MYGGQVRDLLNPWLPYTLVVRGSKMQGFYVENLSMVEFQNLEGFMKLLERGTDELGSEILKISLMCGSVHFQFVRQ